MISELVIKNFRSIIEDKITLTPLTVLIGANGSGKSNLVKALEFISDLPRVGVQLAISKQGGKEGIMPKIIPLKEINNRHIYFKYRTRLNPPYSTQDSPESVDVEHEFELKINKNGRVGISKECLEFHKVLYVGKVLSAKDTIPEIGQDSPEHPNNDSYFKLSHQGNTPKFSTVPPINDETLNSYIYWLGLEALQDKISTPKDLNKFLKTFPTGRSRRIIGKEHSNTRKPNGLFVDPNIATLLDFAPQAQYFFSEIKAIKRYDLLLHELRREQTPKDSPVLSKHGENMPAALRSLLAKKIEFSRLKDSFETIAPHIFNMKPFSLKTGNEFIEFIESSKGRNIESWNSSDGSLRALAILVALESANNNSIVIIEEPEQNLHPWAVRTLIEHMREIVKEKNVQIILTTHSEQVLERIEPNEVRVVNRDPEEGTKFKRIEQIIPNSDIKMGEVGKLWVKGLLSGVPKAP